MTFEEIWKNLKYLLFPENPFSGNSIRNSVLIVFILVVLLIFIGIRVKKHDPMKKPTPIVALAEMLVSWINGMCKELMGKRWKKYAPYILTLAIFIFISNISGMFGLTSPTANLIVTVTLGVITAVITQMTCIITQGFGKWLKSFCEPIPLLLPLNIISEAVVPFSLGMRLFGNIVSGSIILGIIHFVTEGLIGEVVAMMTGIPLIGSAIGSLLTIVIAPVFHAIFDIFFGAIQTYVFVLLSTLFISNKLPEEETA